MRGKMLRFNMEENGIGFDINKFINLVDKGLKRKYLKEAFNIQKSIKDILVKGFLPSLITICKIA